MASVVTIRSSNNTATPTGLVQGQLAYTANGGKLFIMANGVLTPIGGSQTPGTLTANQAIVVNSTSGIDKLITANLTISGVSVNTINNIANSTVLGAASNNELASTWAVKTYIDAKALAGGNVSAGGTNTQIQFNDSSNFGGSAGFTFDKTTNNVTIANTLTAAILAAGNSTVNVVINSVAMVYSVAASAVTTNALGIFAGANVNLGLSGLVVGNSTVNALVNSSSLSLNGAQVVNSTGVSAGVLYGSQVNSAANLSLTGANVSMVNAILSVKDVNVSGNLTVSGTMTTVDSTSLQVKDSMIKLADQNASNVIDIGFYGLYNNGSNRYTGLAWQASTSKYILFANNLAEPGTTIDTSNTSFALATLNSYLQSGGFTTNSTAFTATANSTWAVNLTANTLTLSTPLGVASGGIGLATVTALGVLVGNGTGPMGIAASVDGGVLQANSTATFFSTLIDGGTF